MVLETVAILFRSLRDESTTIYASSKLNRVGRRAARYDSGLTAHKYNRPAHKRPAPHRIAREQIACSRSRCGNLSTLPPMNPLCPATNEQPTLLHNHARYDGDGNRIQKSNGKIYWYGAGTEILDESDASGNFTNEYVFFGGKRVAMRNVTSGTIYYYEEDMLGSSRTMVQAGQTTVCYDADFYPFGGERGVVSTCTQNYKFEGKERDTETGNDDFGARYYTSRLGRWLSADWSSVPAPVPYANLTNPQTLNLYAMVSDNPETFADLDGHCGDNCNNEPRTDPSGSNKKVCDLKTDKCNDPTTKNANGHDQDKAQQQSQQNQRSSTSQESKPSLLANVCNSSACMKTLAAASNFSAGAGDALTLGLDSFARKGLSALLGNGYGDNVNRKTVSYAAGVVTGVAVGAALGKEIAERPNNTQIKVALHEAHHTFGSLGKLAHIQVNVWKAGVAGSGWALRIPLPW